MYISLRRRRYSRLTHLGGMLASLPDEYKALFSPSVKMQSFSVLLKQLFCNNGFTDGNENYLSNRKLECYR